MTFRRFKPYDSFCLKYSPSTALTVSGTDSRLRALCSVLHASGVS
jgi:hypothetical protein